MPTGGWSCAWGGRCQQGTESRLARARFPWQETLEQFDCSLQSSIGPKVVGELARPGLVGHAENAMQPGPPGDGETRIAIAPSIKAAKAGHRLLSDTLQEFVGRLKKARARNRFDKQLRQIDCPKVFAIDEIGYLSLSRGARACSSSRLPGTMR